MRVRCTPLPRLPGMLDELPLASVWTAAAVERLPRSQALAGVLRQYAQLGKRRSGAGAVCGSRRERPTSGLRCCSAASRLVELSLGAMGVQAANARCACLSHAVILQVVQPAQPHAQACTWRESAHAGWLSWVVSVGSP
eukprot:jgi/Ulvmu1/11120/UM071_0003.1